LFNTVVYWEPNSVHQLRTAACMFDCACVPGFTVGSVDWGGSQRAICCHWGAQEANHWEQVACSAARGKTTEIWRTAVKVSGSKDASEVRTARSVWFGCFQTLCSNTYCS